MNEKKYFQERVEGQIDWYNRNSVKNKILFRALQTCAIVFATSIPFLTGFISDQDPIPKNIIGILGLLTAIITGVVSLFKFQENWLTFRTTCESLKHEKYLFLTKSEPYNSKDAFNIFVARVESLISKENTDWAQKMHEFTKTKSS